MSFWDVFFEDGNINTVISRPKMGKTNAAVDLGCRAIDHGYTVLSNIIFFKPKNIERAKKKGWLNPDIDYFDKPNNFKYIPLSSKLVLEATQSEYNILIMDEGGTTASAYKALGNSAVQMRYLGYNIRKIGGCLIIIAQVKNSVVPDLREELVNYEVHLQKDEEGVRSLDFLKRHEFYNPDKKEYDIEFIPYDNAKGVPQANIPYDTKSTAGFIWDINLYDLFYEIVVREYDAFEARENLPDIIRNLVAEKRIDDHMKKKQFMSIGKVAELFKVTDQTIRNWTDNGMLNCIKTDKGTRLYSRSEVSKIAIEKGIFNI